MKITYNNWFIMKIVLESFGRKVGARPVLGESLNGS